MASYVFKPTALRPAETWTLEDGALFGPDGRAATLSEVTRARWIDMPVQRLWSSFLELETPQGKMRVGVVDQVHGEERARFLGLALDVVAVTASMRPETPVLIGGRGVNLVWAISGLIVLALGGLLAAGPLVDGINDASWLMFGFGGVLALAGGFIFWTNAPWRRLPRLTASEFLGRLSQSTARA